jgi:hypothetical protein
MELKQRAGFERVTTRLAQEDYRMNHKAWIGLMAGVTACMTLASAAMPAGAQDAGPQAAGPNNASATTAQVGTTFTFQCQLKKDGGAFSGACSFRFTLFDAATGVGQVGTPQAVDATVINGLFTASLDFGNQFRGDARWLETAVKCEGDADFIPQSPRLNMTSSPYAIGLIPGATVRGGSNRVGLWMENTSTAPDAVAVTANAYRGEGGTGVSAVGSLAGVFGSGWETGAGVRGNSENGPGVWGWSRGNAGVYGKSDNAFGVYGEADNNYAIKGKSLNSFGVFGGSTNSAGVYGYSVHYDGVIGKTNNPARYAVYADGKVAISGGTDIAERFSSASGQAIEPGTVVVVDEAHPGQISPSGAAYARTVVGIVSGAGGVEPGLVLHQKGMMEGPHVVAIAGRVYVKVTTANGAIRAGDLLTTSDVAGHAMKATDRERGSARSWGRR